VYASNWRRAVVVTFPEFCGGETSEFRFVGVD
jgi:hypothetical protein